MILTFRPLLIATFLFLGIPYTYANVSEECNLTSTPLIPRSILFGNPDRAQIRLSPDAKHFSWLAPVNKVMNLWVAPIDKISSCTALTHESGHGVSSHWWAWTGKHIIYPKDKDGDENDHLICVNLDTETTRDLTPFDGVKAEVVSISRRFPEEIIIGLNNRNPKFHDLWKLNINTGETTMVLKNDEFAGFELDEDYNVRLGSRYLENGDYCYWKRNAADDSWTTYIVVPSEEALNFQFVGFDDKGEKIRVIDPRNRDKAALFEWDFETQKSTLIVEDPRADISKVMTNPQTLAVEAVGIEYDKPEWILVTEAVQKDLQQLGRLTQGDAIVTARSSDDTMWTVSCTRDNGPVEFYLWDRKNSKATSLGVSQENLLDKPLSSMQPVIIKTRDNLDMVSYLTLPADAQTSTSSKGFCAKPYPMVLLVHGGPIARDSWGYDGEVQLLANRGYAVLQVNYRGSTGFGKAFINAAVKQWYGTMQDDLVDAVLWAVKNGITQPEKVAIMGASYGGFATLAGLTRDPDVFAAGVDIVGPSNLETLLSTIPPYWEPAIKYFHRFVGNPGTSEGVALLKERSPLTYADRISKPLLIGQGANDPRVKQAESDQIVRHMKTHNLPVIYALYPDEGHGFARPENRISFMAIVEQFLSQHLGGRAEPVGNAFEKSSLKILEGANFVTTGTTTRSHNTECGKNR